MIRETSSKIEGRHLKGNAYLYLNVAYAGLGRARGSPSQGERGQVLRDLFAHARVVADGERQLALWS